MPKLARVRNISSSGIFLETEDRWPKGEVIQLTLEREEPAERPSELQIQVQVRIIAHGQDGVGSAFILPEGLDPQLWEALVDYMDAQPETEQVAFIFRLVRTMLFLCRLCPTGSQDIIQSLGKGLDGSRTESALRIALNAEVLLARESDGNMKHAHPEIVASILKDGSWSNDELVRQLWTGLLVSSCTADGMDESNRPFIELLHEVTATQALFLVAGCRDALTAHADEPSHQKTITPEEIIELTGVTDLYRNATDVSYLFNFGLIKNVFDFTSYLPKNGIDITPSALGLELFKRCQGHLLMDGSNLR
jgi:hypothetical protein